MTVTLSHLYLSLFCLLLLSSFSSARIPGSGFRPFSPKQHAEMLIRALNLFPKDTVNVLPHNSSIAVAGPMLVENRLNLTILGDSGSPSVQDLGHHAGYYHLPSKSARMFYFFFESRNKTEDPVVIWLTGGPGCSSELALFYENGPFKIANNLSLVWNDFGWDKGFFKEHPKYANNDFYITGESYAGHYIPAFASRIKQGNKANEGIHVNLKGIAIGNGLTNPGIQYKAYTDYALENKLITESDYENINQGLPDCEEATQSCATGGGDACLNAYQVCNDIFSQIKEIIGGKNYYDIRKQCVGRLCYDFSNMENLLNQQSVKDALGVGDTEFVSCSTEVYSVMMADWMKNLEVGIPALLEDGIKVLVYVGEYDLICNWIGNSRWVNAMEWSGKKDFGVSPNVSFVVDGAEVGKLKSYGPLSFLKVHDAGHMVPMDQPNAAIRMLKSWMQGNISTAEIKG